ncbi:restriction endonuclease-related protein [Streptomyces clavifer]|uniref:restriction endonuclease-related protein n=1 Tax=Streptomyces clavifer TaxID=68188 RepID=UPI0037F3B360
MNATTGNDVGSEYEIWAKSQVSRSVLRAANAMTAPGVKPTDRLAVLMECHGSVMAARGPVAPLLAFADFRSLLRGDPSQLLPDDVSPWDLDGLRTVDDDGYVTENAFDIDAEQRMVLRILSKYGKWGGLPDAERLDDEIAQETAFAQLTKAGDQTRYENGRGDLIRCPAGPIGVLSELRLPPLVADLYREIPYAAVYRGWWFACPVCRWPMRVSLRREARRQIGIVTCWHEPHRDMGASYRFQPVEGIAPPVLLPDPAPPRPEGPQAVLHPDVERVPEAQPTEGSKALLRGVWRYTVVPGLAELALRDRLVERGVRVELWPAMDAYDLRVHVGRKRSRKKEQWRVDVKDYTSAATLGAQLHAQGGDRGGADWLVVPDHRAKQVPKLSGVAEQYNLRVASASEFGQLVCAASGAVWA